MPAKKRRKERWAFQRVVNVGGCRMNCGIKCSPYCRPANRTRWGVIVPEWMIAKRWMPFSTVYGRGATGKRSMPQGSVKQQCPSAFSGMDPSRRLSDVMGGISLLDYDALKGLDWEWQAMD